MDLKTDDVESHGIVNVARLWRSPAFRIFWIHQKRLDEKPASNVPSGKRLHNYGK
jgi:hypothetical protein